jgi:hypothetical protein
MALTYSWLLEHVDSISPGDINIAPGASEATMTFIVSTNELDKAFYDLMGWCKISDKVWGNNQRGGFQRQVPMSHPSAAWLYCDGIEIVGVSTNGRQSTDFANVPLAYSNIIYNTGDPIKAVDYTTVPFFAEYKYYKIRATFKSVDYFPLTDEQLEPVIVGAGAGPKQYTYWKRKFDNAIGVEAASYYDFREYLRFTSLSKFEPGNEIITNQNARLYWKSLQPGQNNNQFPAPIGESPITFQNAPTNFQNITKNVIKITLRMVPYSCILNPKLVNTIGMINYGGNFDEDPGDVTVWNYEFFNFQAGTLLFTGCEYDNIRSTFPIIPFSAASREDMLQNYLKNQLIDLTFNFIQFVIPPDQLVLPDLANLGLLGTYKMYTNGFNFLPSANRIFYYAESGKIDKKNIIAPPYTSYPFQNLYDFVSAV